MMKHLDLIKRISRMLLDNPRRCATFLRMEYRHRIGIPRDRRFSSFRSGPPTNLSVNLTMRCNLKCHMCRHIHHLKNRPAGRDWYDLKQELPISTWVSVLDQLTAFRPLLYITGGEPLIYPHFEEFIQEAKARNLTTILQTNGILLSRHADFLVRMGVEGVTCSLDGPPDIHDAIRNRAGAFALLKEGILAVRESRRGRSAPHPFISTNFTITRGNLDRIDEVVALSADMGVDFMQIQHTMFNPPELVLKHNGMFTREKSTELGLEVSQPPIAEGEDYQSEITSEDIPRLKKSLIKAKAAAKGRLKLLSMPNLDQDQLEPYYLDIRYPFPAKCAKFWQCLRILADGTVSPCLNFIVGNVKHQSVEEIWNGDQMQTLRALIARNLFPACQRCCSRSFARNSRAF
ncbi:MAG: radical SAM protein [Deltaproteobacteria bacterium]|nr:radical SAM protein [Deltaproteobacteria bacterium]